MSSAQAAGGDTGGLFAAIDAKDGAAFVAYLTEDAVFRFGSAPPVQGRDAIQAAVDGFFSTIGGCAHAVDNTLRQGDTLVCEGVVTYTRHDGSKISLPFTDVFEYENDLIAHYKIYMDIGPLYAD
ncbi:MAG: nuclear transport factor 2 family protein [Gammaproteobacteria bacterium]|nr:nuclear transport factor 2 family protein [Gammaproteobacteria bacterium]MDH5618510.1 nuclear transport factor 2 family protein [Gammaproteobacteria bacterium]